MRALQLYADINPKAAAKIKAAIPKISQNFALMNLIKYKLKEKHPLEITYIDIQPDISFVDFYGLHSFKLFLNNFFGGTVS